MKKQQKFLMGSFIIALLFLIWTIFLYFKSFNLRIDGQIQQFMQANHSNFGDIFFKIITASVNIIPSMIGVLMFVLFLWFKKQYRAITLFLTAIFITQILVVSIKYFVGRPRPLFENYNFILDQFSYPSGHTTLGVVWYGFMTYWLVIKKSITKTLRGFSFILGVLLILLIGISRLYLSVHWFSDVIAGFLLGLTVLLSLIWKMQNKKITPDNSKDL